MKRFVFAALALFAVALAADAQVVHRGRGIAVNRGAVVARGVARAVGFGLGFRGPLGFGYGHQAFVQPFVGQSFYGHQAFVQPFVGQSFYGQQAFSIVQPVQALTTVQAVAPLVQAQAVVGDCCHTQAFASPVIGVSAVHGYGVQRIVRQRFVGHGYGGRAFLGGGLYGGFGRLGLFR